ncbi:Hypothetical predicted protein [Prunus dulcis]|uniref:Uncharacterized protein n=1 Tax=Prunus dulcis TaxID=3755 RepID=A0A5E4F0X4_PRUDU|nr:hypothetical protein L3X38_021018 [Prunus dulcis]VVA21593.1 Hypothetical predicted protein [Prunus dulcis]
MSTLFQQKEMKLCFEHARGQFGGLNLDHHTGLEGVSQQDESQNVSGVLLGSPEEEDDVKSLFLHGKMYFEHATGQFGGLNLDHRTGLEGVSQQDESQHVRGVLLGRPEEEDGVKSLFLHGKMYFEPATGQFVGLYLDHRTGLEGESEQDESTDVSGVPEDMDLSDNGDGEDDMDLSDIGDGEDDTVDEGGGDTEDEGADGDEFGFNDGGDDSSDGGPMSLPIMLVATSPPSKNRIGFVRNYFDCGSVHALELRVKGVLRRELNRDNYRISYFKHGPTDDGIEVDISGMSWGEVIESELQGAFAHDDLDPGHDAGASCSRPKRKREEPTYLKDYYTY